MKKLLFCSIILFFNVYSSDEFGEESEISDRKVVLRDNKISKSISIATIRGYQYLDRFAIRPIAYFYSKSTTLNFRNSFANFLDNFSNGGDIVNNILIFSDQRLISSFGNVIFNSSVGMLGTSNASSKFKLENAQTSSMDVLRFYNVPEVFFFQLGIIPITFVSLTSYKLTSITRKKYSSSSEIGLFTDSLLSLANQRAQDMETFDLFLKLKPEDIYNIYKSNIYQASKEFKIKKDLYAIKKKLLKGFLEEKNL
jgi:ABC-type transporter lipoprotein component MlaA